MRKGFYQLKEGVGLSQLEVVKFGSSFFVTRRNYFSTFVVLTFYANLLIVMEAIEGFL